MRHRDARTFALSQGSRPGTFAIPSLTLLLLACLVAGCIAEEAAEDLAVEGDSSAALVAEDVNLSITPQDTNCGSWPGNGIADHDVKTRRVTHGGRTVRFALVNQRLSDHSFAAFRDGYRDGDQSWVDRSYDGGANWVQCGPFSRKFSNDLLNYHNWMRACVRFNGASFCTDWHYDT